MQKLTKEATETLDAVEKAALLMQAATQDLKATMLEMGAEVLKGIEEVQDGFTATAKLPNAAKQMMKLPAGGDLEIEVTFNIREVGEGRDEEKTDNE
jgi:uncharacterized protein Yka (UPF0111/DUF47 family)